MTMPPDLPTLPEGWEWTRLGEIVVEIERGNPKDTPEKDFIYLDIASIDNNQKKITNPKKYFGENAPSRARQIVKSGDILFSTVRTYLKNIAIVNDIYDGQIASTGFCVIRPYDLINQRLIFYLVQTDFFLNPLTQIQRGTSYPAVRDSDVFAQFIPLPPLPEQHRIVDKIDELFTKLDAGVKSLEKTKAQLKRYRQAVLKHAFEGKLTEEWRERHNGELEPASVLLERINEERKKTLKGKYKEQPPLDTSNLPYLPEGWMWTRVGEIGEAVTGTTPSKSKKEYYGTDFPFLKPTDLNDGYYVKKSEDGLSRQGIEKARLLPAKSILVTCIGATIGKTGFIRIEGASNQQINAIIPEKQILPEFIYFLSISPQFQKDIIDNASATTLPILNKSKFEFLSIPLPPLSEQHKIVEETERRFSVADDVEKTVDQSLKQAERLRQSILKRAFEGKLVPQDLNDEPASVLIERIKEEKAKRETEQKAKKTNKKKKPEKKEGTKNLSKLLKSAKRRLTPNELWKLSNLSISEFYDELKKEVEEGKIVERKMENNQVFLEVKK